MLETLKESTKFSAVQLVQLRPKLPAPPAGRRTETAMSSSFGSLSEPSGKDGSKGAWNFHPLFMQTDDDEPIAGQSPSLPATAFSRLVEIAD